MDASINVLHGMVNYLMRVLAFQSVVREKGIRKQCGTSFDVISDFTLKGLLLGVVYDLGVNFPAAFQDAHNSDLVVPAGSSDSAFPFLNVHVSGLAADVCLVRLNLAAEQAEPAILKREANTVIH